MALNAGTLATAIENGVRSSQSLGATPYPQLTSYCQALATAIVDHIKNNAEIDTGKANGYTEEIETTPGPNLNKSQILDVPVTGGIK